MDINITVEKKHFLSFLVALGLIFGTSAVYALVSHGANQVLFSDSESLQSKFDSGLLGGESFWSPGTNGRIYYNDGNIGIGTSAPSAKLEIYDSGTFNPALLTVGEVAIGHAYTGAYDATGICTGGLGSGKPTCFAAVNGAWYWGYQTDSNNMATTAILESNGNFHVGNNLYTPYIEVGAGGIASGGDICTNYNGWKCLSNQGSGSGGGLTCGQVPSCIGTGTITSNNVNFNYAGSSAKGGDAINALHANSADTALTAGNVAWAGLTGGPAFSSAYEISIPFGSGSLDAISSARGPYKFCALSRVEIVGSGDCSCSVSNAGGYYWTIVSNRYSGDACGTRCAMTCFT